MPVIRDVRVKPASDAIDLKTFRVRLEGDIGNFGPGRRINDRNAAFAVTDENTIGLRIDANIVRVVTKLDASARSVVGTLEQANGPVARVCNVQSIGRRHITDALRLAKACDGLDQFPAFEIDDANGVITEFGHEQSLASGIDCEMVDAAPDLAKWHFRFEFEAIIGRVARYGAKHGERRNCDAREAL